MLSRRSQIPILLVCIVSLLGFSIGTPNQLPRRDQHPLITPPFEYPPPPPTANDNTTFPAFLEALEVLQEDYFAIWAGIWPTSIDWTSAVIGTYLSSALTTLSTSLSKSPKDRENIINKYFSQLVGSYFGQDAFSLRQEAYDDMLWVVLGWLESIKFIHSHSALHYERQGKEWYGKQYIPAFAHRARLFWDIASQGWDTKLCNGGMIWSPYLVPYKNAITNELFVAGSIAMYLHFPGDMNTSPFGFSVPGTTDVPPARPRDPKYLAAAIEAYKWLNASNMTNKQGLYVDGFHVSGWSKDGSKNHTRELRCDQRNEMVYTYNQGVLLSGQRGLYEATGAKSYIVEGHRLVADVIAATGWNLMKNDLVDLNTGEGQLGKWHGLGRSGVMEEGCDALGYCSQNGQTFKGIFFEHLTSFCAGLPDHLVLPEGTFVGKDFEEDRKWHRSECRRYVKWVKHNARAAQTTRNEEGRFGMWWGAPKGSKDDLNGEVEIPENAVDYRNQGVPDQWEMPRKSTARRSGSDTDIKGNFGTRDLNDRGRGRTVETQGGGVSILRAAWELSR